MAASDQDRWVLLFDSIHHVLAAERAFKEYQVWCDVVPVPRELSSDCGMAIEVRPADLAEVRRVLADPRVSIRAVYQPTEAGRHVQVSALIPEEGS